MTAQKSVYKTASELVDAWPYSVHVKSSQKSMLAVIVAEELSKQYQRGYNAGHEAAIKEETK